MNHKVQNVGQLHADAKLLYDKVVVGSGDDIIANLKSAIEILKTNWEGKDAGVQINNVIEIYNAMVEIRNALAGLAKDSAKVAVSYREIQIANQAGLGDLSTITPETRTTMEFHVDERDTINIKPEAVNGRNKLEAVIGEFDDFANGVRTQYDAIMNNWQIGSGRDQATEAFDNFISKANQYKQTLEEVSSSIETALRNYEI